MSAPVEVRLKPCPFCDGEAEEVVGFKDDHGFGVRCKRSYCAASTRGHPTRELAAARWNTRTEAQSRAAVSGELEDDDAGLMLPDDVGEPIRSQSDIARIAELESELAALRDQPSSEAEGCRALLQEARDYVDETHGDLQAELANRIDAFLSTTQAGSVASVQSGGEVERLRTILTDYTKDAEIRVTLALVALNPSEGNDHAG